MILVGRFGSAVAAGIAAERSHSERSILYCYRANVHFRLEFRL
jgi:hypothetical protein